MIMVMGDMTYAHTNKTGKWTVPSCERINEDERKYPMSKWTRV